MDEKRASEEVFDDIQMREGPIVLDELTFSPVADTRAVTQLSPALFPMSTANSNCYEDKRNSSFPSSYNSSKLTHFTPPLKNLPGLCLDPALPPEKQKGVQLYKRRWLILFLFAAYSTSNAYQWIHLNIIGDKVLIYYNSSLPNTQYMQQVALDWLSMIYMLAYIPLIFPLTWLLDKKGLQVIAISGALLNAIGAWVKCAALHPDRFALVVSAQTVCAIAQVFILGIPAHLAAVWFGPNEVSTATAIGVFGNQVMSFNISSRHDIQVQFCKM